MKKLKKYEIGIIAAIPVLYVMAYFGFLALAKPSGPPAGAFFTASTPAVTYGSFAPPQSVTIITGNVPLGHYAVKIFSPAINLHKKLTGDTFIVKVHELA